jgi:hypothetical protein
MAGFVTPNFVARNNYLAELRHRRNPFKTTH